MQDLTPSHLKCFHGTCPSVHELCAGRLLIVGKRGDRTASEGGAPVGEDEYAIIIDRALLANVHQISNPTAPVNPYDPIDENYRDPDVIFPSKVCSTMCGISIRGRLGVSSTVSDGAFEQLPGARTT
jgi:hypothetical protein